MNSVRATLMISCLLVFCQAHSEQSTPPSCSSVTSQGCRTCINAPYSRNANGKYEQCNWCNSNDQCYDFNLPSQGASYCDVPNTVNIAHSSKCDQLFGMPIATAIIVLIVAGSVPICAIVLIVVCCRKAQKEREKAQSKVVRVPGQMNTSSYSGKGYSRPAANKSPGATYSYRDNNFDQPLINESDDGIGTTDSPLNSNYVPPNFDLHSDSDIQLQSMASQDDANGFSGNLPQRQSQSKPNAQLGRQSQSSQNQQILQNPDEQQVQLQNSSEVQTGFILDRALFSSDQSENL